MKLRRIIPAVIVSILWLNAPTVFAQAQAPAKSSEQTTTDEFDVLLNSQTAPPPQAPPTEPGSPEALEAPGEGMLNEVPPAQPPSPPGVGAPPGPMMNPQPGFGGKGRGGPFGNGMRPGMGPGMGDRYRDRQGFGEQIDPQVMLNFLKENEPKLAEKLEKLRAENPEKFNRSIRTVSQIYGPVMVQMNRDPEMGKLSLQRIRLRLKSEQLLKKYQEAAADQREPIKAELKKTVSDQFDVILKQEEMRQEKITARLKAFAPDDKAQAAGNESEGKDGGDKPKRPRLVHAQQRLEHHQQNIENWRKNRDSIIEQRLNQLLSGAEPFPWHR